MLYSSLRYSLYTIEGADITTIEKNIEKFAKRAAILECIASAIESIQVYSDTKNAKSLEEKFLQNMKLSALYMNIFSDFAIFANSSRYDTLRLIVGIIGSILYAVSNIMIDKYKLEEINLWLARCR